MIAEPEEPLSWRCGWCSCGADGKHAEPSANETTGICAACLEIFFPEEEEMLWGK